MGGKESTLKEQSWCSSALNCKNCVTEVENVSTEVKRTTPIPRGEIQSLLNDQKKIKSGKDGNVQSSYSQNNQLIQKNANNNIFASEEKKQEFKSALKQENRVEALKALIDKAPKLQLKVLSSAFLSKGETLIINALGLEDGKTKRNAQDGFTYFGCKKSIKKYIKKSHQVSASTEMLGNEQAFIQMGATGASQEEVEDSKYQTYQKEIVNDFVIPTKNEEEKEKHRGRQFQIYFDKESFNYKIKDLGIGYGAFVKLTKPLVLRDNFLLNMGESYIVANLLKASDEEAANFIDYNSSKGTPQKLRLKIFSVIKADQPDVFCCSNEDQLIIIGRTPNCDIRIEDKLLSKTQATIKYDGQAWVLTDGFDNRESTNGTWLYLNEDCDIEEGMVFKSNQTFFEAHLLST